VETRPEGQTRRQAAQSRPRPSSILVVVVDGTKTGCQHRRRGNRGGSEGECTALELHQLRQRLAARIWSSYQKYICARVPYADPTHDTQRQHAYQAEAAAAKQELMAQRHINEAHMHRVRGGTEWGV
jgi:hypothetical protein